MAGKTFPASLAHAQPVIFRIWQEAHGSLFCIPGSAYLVFSTIRYWNFQLGCCHLSSLKKSYLLKRKITKFPRWSPLGISWNFIEMNNATISSSLHWLKEKFGAVMPSAGKYIGHDLSWQNHVTSIWCSSVLHCTPDWIQTPYEASSSPLCCSHFCKYKQWLWYIKTHSRDIHVVKSFNPRTIQLILPKTATKSTPNDPHCSYKLI